MIFTTPLPSENELKFFIPQRLPKGKSRYFILTLDFVWESPVKLVAVVVANIGISIFKPKFSPQVIATSIVIFASRVVLKVVVFYNLKVSTEIKKILSKYYKLLFVLQVAALIFMIVIIKKSIQLSFAAAFLHGTLCGALTEVEVLGAHQRRAKAVDYDRFATKMIPPHQK